MCQAASERHERRIYEGRTTFQRNAYLVNEGTIDKYRTEHCEGARQPVTIGTIFDIRRCDLGTCNAHLSINRANAPVPVL